MAVKGTATIDFGATPVDEATFIVSDAGLTGLTYAEAWFMAESTGQNDIELHKMAAALIALACEVPGAGSMNVYANVIAGMVTGQFQIRYVAS